MPTPKVSICFIRARRASAEDRHQQEQRNGLEGILPHNWLPDPCSLIARRELVEAGRDREDSFGIDLGNGDSAVLCVRDIHDARAGCMMGVSLFNAVLLS